MKFYNRQHKYYCGVDLHAGKMDVCILDCKGKVVVHLNIKTDHERFLNWCFPLSKMSLSASNVSSAGTGWPICAPITKSILSLDTHYT
jgi:hypothetical protein